MLITLLIWLYVSLLCWTWGLLTLKFFNKVAAENKPGLQSFPVICLIGLSFLSVVTSFLSLIIPMGTWFVQLFLFIPALVAWTRKNTFQLLKRQLLFFKSINIALLFLLSVTILLILVMSTWIILHPDTIGYHVQTIKWIEDFKAIPGLVHIHNRYGLQNAWFVLCSVFSFNWTGLEALTFINSTVLLWYLLFIIERLHESFKTKNITSGTGWLLLFVFSMWEYTQVRLTATSASPDFIAGLYCWLIFYLFSFKEKSTVDIFIIIFLGCVAVTIKLSAFAVILFGFYLASRLLAAKKVKQFLFICLLSIFIITPFISRNIITSGYPVFPSAFPDVSNADWKYDRQQTLILQDYITAYAKLKTEPTTIDDTIRQAKLSPDKWLMPWWQRLSTADRLMFLIFIFLLAYHSFFLKAILFKANLFIKISILVGLSGLFIWLYNAPDPRFATGFIMPLIGIFFLNLGIGNKVKNKIISSKWLTLAFVLTGFALAAYTGYRFVNYFNLSNIIKPVDPVKIPYKTVQCNGMSFQMPLNKNDNCGNIPIPCIYDSCNSFMLRGDKITDGFRAKK
jgi:hypothetical protein